MHVTLDADDVVAANDADAVVVNCITGSDCSLAALAAVRTLGPCPSELADLLAALCPDCTTRLWEWDGDELVSYEFTIPA